MDILIRAHGPGVHSYLPFRSSFRRSSQALPKLQDLCKNSILRHVTLRRLSRQASQLCLPTYLLRYLMTLSTVDFEEIECAPFIDAFSLNFFHRALTYRVFCYVDEQEYMVTHAYSHVEESWIGPYHWDWVEVQHDNIMCVCAIVHDPMTNNVFYLFEQPKVSLVQICSVLSERNAYLPEVLLWRVLIDLSSALSYILSRGLCYGMFGLDNVFVVKDKVVLENCLTRKTWRSKTSECQFCMSVNKNTEDPEEEALACLTTITRKLIPLKSMPFYSKMLRDFVTGENSPKSLASISELANGATEFMKDPISFAELVQNLKHSTNQKIIM